MATTQANQAIADRLMAMEGYHPATCELLTGWLLDPGDVITVRNGGTDYRVPIFQSDMEWKGESEVQIQSKGNEKRPALSELKRNRYASGKRQEEDEKELNQVIYKTDFTKTDEGIGMLATAVGVKIDPTTGKPKIDPTTGKWEFDANGASLTGQINVTAGGISQRVTQAEDDIGTLDGELTVEAGKISQIVTAVGADGQVTAASIVTAINNQTGESVIKLNANRIILDGAAVAASLASETIECDGIDVGAGAFSVDNEGYISCGGIDINGTTLDGSFDDWIVNASVSGNTLTLTKFDGTTINFSKAGSVSVSSVDVSGLTANNWTTGTMFTMTVTVTLSNGATSTHTIPINTEWAASAADDVTAAYCFKKIGSVSGALTLTSSRYHASRVLQIDAPKVTSAIQYSSNQVTVYYNRITGTNPTGERVSMS